MKLKLIGHNFLYATEQIIMAFFTTHDDVNAVSSVSVNGDSVTAITSIEQNGKKSEHTITRTGVINDKFITNTIKMSAYMAAKKISKLSTPWGIQTGIRPTKMVREFLDAGLSEDEVRKLLCGEYWIEPQKIELCINIAKKEQRIINASIENGISLYIGIPFCPTRCLYCSFISSSAQSTWKYIPLYIDALIEEMKYTKDLIKGRKIETIYIGGGTPTTLSEALLEKLLCAIDEFFDLSYLKEYTVEAGRPDTITREKLKIIKRHGISRLSINPQTMNQETLDKIGRKHTPKDIVDAFKMAREEGFNSINADIIVGLPGEDVAMFNNTLSELIPLSPESITVHTMYIKRASRLKEELFKHDLQDVPAPKMLSIANSFMLRHGYSPYYMYRQKSTLGNLENIGFSKEGHEGLYNVYIMEEMQTIIAMGAGATSKIVNKDKIERIFNIKDPLLYIDRIDEIKHRKDGDKIV